MALFQKLPEKAQALLFISIIACIAYWDIVSMKHTMKWDMIDGTYPSVTLQSQMEKNHELPLWDPYSYFGSAFHSKMACWYPLRFISCKISPYTLAKINLDYVLHIIIAGMGMFLVARRLKFAFFIALTMGISYMFSGFFSGNAQHMAWIISGTWLPYVLLLYYDMLWKPSSWKISLCFVFVFFSFIIGGYPAFSIVVGYGLLIACIWRIIHILIHKQLSESRSILFSHIIALIPLVILLSPTIVSLHDMSTTITRGDGISLKYVLTDAILPKHFITCIFPFVSAYRINNFWELDQSMMNWYFGISLFLLALSSVRLIRKRSVFALWIIALFFISLSFARTVPILPFLYHHLPLFNLFRFPPLFRLFSIFCFIILAGYSLQDIFDNYSTKTLFLATKFLAIAFGGIVFILLIKFPIIHIPTNGNWYNYIETLQIPEILFIQSCLFFFICIITIITAIFIKHKKNSYSFPIVFLTLSLLELISFTKLNSAVSVTSQFNPLQVQKEVDKLPATLGIRNISQQTVSEFDGSLAITMPLWRNNQIFHKRMTYSSYTSFVYKQLEVFEHSRIYDSVKKYPFAYIPSVVYDSKDTTFDYSQGNRIAIIPNFKKGKIAQSHSLSITQSHSNEFMFSVAANDSIPLVLMQNKYPGWEVFVNNKRQTISAANIAFMCVIVPPGTSTVRFSYAPRKVVATYYIFEYGLYILIILLVLGVTRFGETKNLRKVKNL